MRRAPALAVLLLGLGLPACAQRGASHGGFSGHASSGFHGSTSHGTYGGFGTSARPGFSAARFNGPGSLPTRFAGARTPGTYSRYAAGVSTPRPVFYTRARGAYSGQRPVANAYAYRNGDRRYDRPRYGYPGFAGYGLAYPFLTSFWDYPFDPFWDDSGTLGYDTASAAPDTPYGPTEAAPPYAPEWPPQDNSYAPAPPPASTFAATPPSPPEEEDPVTIIFKDGRPPEQIRNYALTRSTLFLPGRHMREIPLDEIDLPATEKANRAAGIDFHPPTPR